MPVGTVRGRFELDAPALRTLRDLEKQGIRTNAQMRLLGESMDKVADRHDKQRIDAYRTTMRQIGRDTAKGLIEAESAWAVTTKRINKHIDSTIARVELLHRRIEALGRARGVATVGTRETGGGIGRALGGGALAGAAGGRRGGGAIRSLSFGPAALRGPAGMALIGAGLPLLPALGGAGVGLLGSAGMGALGAGALGLPAALGAGVGFGSMVAAAKPATTAIKEVSKAQADLNDKIREFGRRSEEAREARQNLTLVMEATRAPRGTLGLVREAGAFRRQWQRLTRPATQQFIGGLREQVGFGRRIAPAAAGAALTSTVAARAQARQFGRFATGRFGRRALGVGAEIFAENLPAAERTLENILRTFLNLARAARPFFRDSTRGIQRWTRGWADSTSDIRDTRSEIGEMVDHLRSWVRLGRSAVGLAKELFGAAAGPGRGLVDEMTMTLDRWTAWMRANPREVRAFFRRSIRAAKEFASAVWEITRAVGKLSDDLLPLLQHFSTLVSGAGQLGLLTPGVGALAYGAYRGARGRGRGAAAPAAAAGPAAAGLAPLAAAAAVGAGAARPGGAAAGGRLGAMMFGQGFRPGAPVSQLGPRARGLGRIPPVAGRLAGGAARMFWPIAALQGALTFAGTEGNVRERTGAAVSGLTMGAIPFRTDEQRREEARRRVLEEGGLGGRPARTVGGLRRQIRRGRAELRERRAETRETVGEVRGPGELGEQIAEASKRGNRDLQRELRNRTKLLREYKKQIRAIRLPETERDIAEAFEIRLKGKGPREAIRGLTRDTLEGFKTQGRQGRRQLAQNALMWAREQRQKNPQLTGVYRQLRRRIIEQFRAMGQDIKIINGRIFTGSRKEWGNISNALSTAAEKARQEVNKSFTAIQRKALGSLRAMGFSASEARRIVRGLEEGGQAGRAARFSAAEPQAPAAGGRTIFEERPNARGGRVGGFQRGGRRVWGAGRGDNVRPRAAPGELIVNRHTEGDVDRDLRRAGRPTLGDRVARERRPHSALSDREMRRKRKAPGAPPGRDDIFQDIMPGLQRGGRASGGGLPQARLNAMIARANAIDRASYPYVWGGGHGGFNGPYDCSGAVSAVLHAGGYLNTPMVSGALAGFGAPGPGTVTIFANPGHTFMSIQGRGFGTGAENPGGGAGWLSYNSRPGFTVSHLGAGGALGPPGAGAGFTPIRLRAPRTRLRGAPGAMSQRAGDVYARGLQRRVNRRLAQMGGGGVPTSGGGNAAANQALAQSMLGQFGWGPGQMAALRTLWTQESGWSQTARNPQSGAYGIPQGLPPSKMGAAAQGSGPAAARAQIAWGLRYIKDRYGSPSAAWAFHQSHNWYGRGGRVPGLAAGGSFEARRPSLFMAGEGRNRERVTVTPIRPRQRRATARAGGGGRRGGGDVNVSFRGATFHVRREADVERVAEAVGKKIREALRDQVDDEEVGV
jgi:hypothetical protein